jgi:hypothetical protein
VCGTVEARALGIRKKASVARSRHRSIIGGTTANGVMCNDLRYEQRSKQYSRTKDKQVALIF